MEQVLVTGGAGFIGSHLVDRLAVDYEVIVLDDMSGGISENLEQHLSSERVTIIEGSILSKQDLDRTLKDVKTVFHFAAQPDVRLSVEKPLFDFEVNVKGSLMLLEKMREHGVGRMIFASSEGIVYGETSVFPTPEETAFDPISNYGAAKGAVEMYLASYLELYGIQSISLRFGNIIGPRCLHGVIYDFYKKLKNDSSHLEILGTCKTGDVLDISTEKLKFSIGVLQCWKMGLVPINPIDYCA